jgi:hypothetical protein
MHAQRVAVAIAAAVGLLCTFLPWASVPLFGSVDGTKLNDGRAWITFALCAAILVGAAAGNRNGPFSAGATAICVLFGLAVAGIALWTIVEFLGASNGGRFSSSYSVGVGLYLLAAAGIAIIVLPAIVKPSSGRPSPAYSPPTAPPPPGA